MKKLIISTVLSSVLSFQAMAQQVGAKVPVSDFRAVISESCQMINPAVIKYLRESDYIEKKTRYLELSINYNQESEEMFEELRDDAAKTAMASKIIMSASILLLARNAPLATAGTGGVVTKAVNVPVNMVEALALTPGAVRVTIGAAILPGAIIGLAGGAYLTFIEPFVSGYEYAIRNAETQKDAQKVFANLGKDFKNAHSSLDELRSKVDLDYSPLMNGLTLGGKAKDATEQLYSISVAKTILFQAELDLIKKLENKVETCK